MSHIILEIVRVAILGAVLGLLLWTGHRYRLKNLRGWGFIVAGFGLLLFGSIMDVTDNFDYLSQFVVVGDTAVQAVLEIFVGYLLGFVLLFLRLWHWLPMLASATQRIASSRPFSMTPTAILVGVGVVVAAIGFAIAQQNHDARAREDLKKHGVHYSALLRASIDRHLDSVRGVANLYAASDVVTRNEFHTFTRQTMASNFGLVALEWIPRVTTAERADYERAAQRDGHPDFQISEETADETLVPSKPRDEYYPILYAVAVPGEELLLGLDRAANPAWRAAMELARDTGKAVITRAYSQQSAGGGHIAILAFEPVYGTGTAPHTIVKRQDALTGFVLGVIHIDELVMAALDHDGAPMPFDVALIDDAAPAGASLLGHYPSPLRREPMPAPTVEDYRQDAVQSMTVDVADRQWSLSFKPLPASLGEHGTLTSWAVAAVAVILSILLAQNLFAKRNRSIEVEQLVADRSRELSASNLALETEMAERLRMEQQLVQTQKMEAMGQLTGGIAHDFNNVLMVIDGYARRAALKIGDDETVETCVQEVLKATERATKLTRQLLSFSRRQVMEKRFFRIGQAVTDVKGLLLRSVGEDYKILFEIQDQKACVESDSGEFGQAILNLVINARDAMPNGGVIVVGTRIVELDEENTQRYRDMNPGRYVEIYVTDYGEGIYEDILPRIFEPFFTTKERGKGTGLGLAIVYGFAQQSGGSIEVDSTLGEGTTFQIYMPIVEYDPTTTTSEVDEMHFGNGETILLVEDDESLLTLTQFTLEDLGYKVLMAGNGIEALEVEEDHEGTIDVLLSDVIMPSMGGFEAAEIIRERRPDIKIVFMSGYPNRGQKMGKSIPERSEFLQKPIQPDHLAKVIRNEIYNEDLRLPA